MHAREFESAPTACEKRSLHAGVRRSLKTGDRELAVAFRRRDQWTEHCAAYNIRRAGAILQEIRFQATRKSAVFGCPLPRLACDVLRTGNHVELLCGGLEFWEQDFEKVPRVFCWPCGAVIGLADEAEELFPPTRDYEADHLGVVAQHLILVDGALLTSVQVTMS